MPAWGHKGQSGSMETVENGVLASRGSVVRAHAESAFSSPVFGTVASVARARVEVLGCACSRRVGFSFSGFWDGCLGRACLRRGARSCVLTSSRFFNPVFVTVASVARARVEGSHVCAHVELFFCLQSELPEKHLNSLANGA